MSTYPYVKVNEHERVVKAEASTIYVSRSWIKANAEQEVTPSVKWNEALSELLLYFRANKLQP